MAVVVVQPFAVLLVALAGVEGLSFGRLKLEMTRAEHCRANGHTPVKGHPYYERSWWKTWAPSIASALLAVVQVMVCLVRRQIEVVDLVVDSSSRFAVYVAAAVAVAVTFVVVVAGL